MSFGGLQWPINPRDMNLGRLSTTSSRCLGGIFDLSAGSNIVPGPGTPAWVVGDVFLVSLKFLVIECLLCTDTLCLDAQKNVYSVYRAEPPSVGFAELSSAAGGSSGAPSPGDSTPPTGGSAPTLSPTSTGAPTTGVPRATNSNNGNGSSHTISTCMSLLASVRTLTTDHVLRSFWLNIDHTDAGSDCIRTFVTIWRRSTCILSTIYNLNTTYSNDHTILRNTM